VDSVKNSKTNASDPASSALSQTLDQIARADETRSSAFDWDDEPTGAENLAVEESTAAASRRDVLTVEFGKKHQTASSLSGATPAMADQELVRLEEQLSQLADGAGADQSDVALRARASSPHSGVLPSSPAISRRSLYIFGLVAVCTVAVAGWLMRSDTGKGAVAQSSTAVQASNTNNTQAAGVPPIDLSPQLQSLSRDLVTLKETIQRLTLAEEKLVRDNEEVARQVLRNREENKLNGDALALQLKANRDELMRHNGQIVEQLKASQEDMTRKYEIVLDQLKTAQDQLARLNAGAITPKPRPEALAPPRRPTIATTPTVVAAPRPALATAPKPATTSPPQRPASSPTVRPTPPR